VRRGLLYGLAFFTLCCCAAAPGGEGPTWTGYIYDETTVTRFDFIAPGDFVIVKFKAPAESHFYARVYGKTGKELGDFDLQQGNTIELSGGGKFSIEIYSRGDNGYWAATLIE